jgi:NADH-quinone oxidoreductase subunit H
VGGRFGWLQSLADGIKLITKEDLAPGGADHLLFRVAPYISFCASFCGYLALPFADNWVAMRLERGRVLHHRRAGAGSLWRDPGRLCLRPRSGRCSAACARRLRSSATKCHWALCVVVPVLIAGTMDLVTIGQMQQGWFTNWFVFHDPFTFIIFWVYFTCATASVNRAPFDLAEAESELVAGFHTEYSGLRWSIFFMAEYGSMFAVSGLAAILFFGGWNGPLADHRSGWAPGPLPAPIRCWSIWATCWA